MLQFHPWEKIITGQVVTDDVAAEEVSTCKEEADGEVEAEADTLKKDEENKGELV